MELGPLLIAVTGAVIGGVVTAVTGWWRTRNTTRTAARLVWAELSQKSAAVTYLRRTGSWPTSSTGTPLWDEHSPALARAWDSAKFLRVNRSYAAFDGIEFLARGPELLRRHKAFVDAAISDIEEGLSTLAGIARIGDEELTRQLNALRSQGGAVVESLPKTGVAVPPYVLQHLDVAALTTPPRRPPDTAPSPGTTPGRARPRRPRVPAEPTTSPVPPSTPTSPATAPASTTSLRVVLDAQHETALPTDGHQLAVARREGDPPTGDPAVDETYDALGATRAFYREVFDRDGLDGRGGAFEAVVHFGRRYPNTFWMPPRLVVGDGDGVTFNRFSVSLEVLAHELAHGVVADMGLRFEGQSGAVLESVCDVLGVLVKQFTLGQTVEQADWRLGVGLLLVGEDQALRSLAAPGTAYDNAVLGRDPQPADMSGYVETETDNGGVHVNSGIPSRAFYLTAAALGGHAWERAGRIWYDATQRRFSPKDGFSRLATVTLETAAARYGEAGEERAAVAAAWHEVGVDHGS